MNAYAQRVYDELAARYPWEKEFLQSVKEVFESLSQLLDQDDKYEKHHILERMTVPERIIQFQVPWVDDKGVIQVNNGFRVQFNSAIGPYKGGLRFHPSVNLSVMKFLGFEQTFKNSLTTLPMGGGKGGSDFSPKGKSDNEVMRFCQSFMRELYRYIGADTDVPAGDIGVGAREIGYLEGQFKRIANTHECVFTGKGLSWGGSLVRPEATGFGALYFVQEMLKTRNEEIKGKTVAISGFGNVAWGAAKKATELGAKVVTISGPDGYIYDPAGLNEEKVAYMLELRASGNDVVAPYADKFAGSTFYAGKKPWEQKVDVAMTCATQNELNENDAKQLIANKTMAVVEVSNMGCTAEAVEQFQKNKMFFAPGKAVNAGGVATSGLEMSQNAMRLSWTAEEVDQKLHGIMKNIHDSARAAAAKFGDADNYVLGANVAGFLKVADAMIAMGI